MIMKKLVDGFIGELITRELELALFGFPLI
jgi:hypothetical protein